MSSSPTPIRRAATDPAVARTVRPWWLIPALLTGPLSAAGVYLAYAVAGVPFDAPMPPGVVSKGLHEMLALGIASVMVALLLPLACLTRDVLLGFLAGLALIVLLREHHFEGTAMTGAVRLTAYVLAGALGGAAVICRKKVFSSPYWPTLRPWLIVVAVAYGWAVVGQRGMFKRLLPDGRPMHVPLEEVGENAAHLLAVFMGAAAWRCRAAIRRAAAKPDPPRR